MSGTLLRNRTRVFKTEASTKDQRDENQGGKFSHLRSLFFDNSHCFLLCLLLLVTQAFAQHLPVPFIDLPLSPRSDTENNIEAPAIVLAIEVKSPPQLQIDSLDADPLSSFSDEFTSAFLARFLGMMKKMHSVHNMMNSFLEASPCMFEFSAHFSLSLSFALLLLTSVLRPTSPFLWSSQVLLGRLSSRVDQGRGIPVFVFISTQE